MKRTRIRAALLCASLGLLSILYATLGHAATIRDVQATARTLVPIRTALGFSTILEFPGKPISAVLGDQDGFKLEYVGTSITLKPLVPNAKSNLFVFTDVGRFNFALASGAASAVDYIVSIKAAVAETKPGEAKSIEPYILSRPRKTSAANGLSLTIEQIRLARDAGSPRAASLIEFRVYSKSKPYILKPSAFGIRQAGKYLELESIYLDRLELLPGTSVGGVIAILNQDWKRGSPIALVFAVTDPPSKSKKPKTTRIEVIAPSSPATTKKGVTNHAGAELFPKAHP